MVATKKFSQFVVGSYNKVGDITVGLRGGVNEQFNFPGIGIQDASGNFLYQYASGGAASVNYLLLNSSVSTAPPILTVGGADTNISLNLEPKGGGNLIFSGLNWPIADGPANYVLGTNGAAQLSFMSPGSFPIAPGPNNTIIISNGSAWVHSTATYLPTLTANLILYASATNVLGQISGANGGVLITSAGGVPSWLANPSSTGNMLQSASGAASTWSTATFSSTYAASTLLYSNGANTVTGLATANSASLVTTSAGVPVWSSTMTNGQVIIGSTGATPTAATLTAGSGVTITNGAASITIASAGGGGFTWTDVTGTSASMAIQNGYIADNAGLVTLTLPSTAAIGSIVAIQGKGAGGWKIAQNASQTIAVGSLVSTSGVGGSIASTNQYDSIMLVCITTNNGWATFTAPQGNITVV